MPSQKFKHEQKERELRPIAVYDPTTDGTTPTIIQTGSFRGGFHFPWKAWMANVRACAKKLATKHKPTGYEGALVEGQPASWYVERVPGVTEAEVATVLLLTAAGKDVSEWGKKPKGGVDHPEGGLLPPEEGGTAEE